MYQMHPSDPQVEFQLSPTDHSTGTLRHLTAVLVCVCCATIANRASAQDDRLLVFDLLTGSVDTLPATLPMDSIAAAMPHYAGDFGGTMIWENVATPEGFMGAGISRPPRAMLTYDLDTYPVRTVGSLRRVVADSSGHHCTAQLVAARYVLTARHCVHSIQGNIWTPGAMTFAPVYDDGIPSGFGSTAVIRYYIPIQSYKDLALLELAEPIGQDLGWIGMAFTTDVELFAENVFHKFTYPATPSPLDSTLIYNGDTLYHIATPFAWTVPSGSGFAVGVEGWFGVPGESGSGLLLAQNDTAQIYGVQSTAGNIRHSVLDPGTYEQFRRVMVNGTTGVEPQNLALPAAEIHPNPMHSSATLQLPEVSNSTKEFTLFDATGRVMKQIRFTGDRSVLERDDLVGGVYFYQVRESNNTIARGRLVVQ